MTFNRKKQSILVAFIFCFFFWGMVYGKEDGKVPEIIEKARSLIPLIQKWAAYPKIVQAVKEENEKGKSLDEIKKADVEWINSVGITPFMEKFLSNNCALYLKELRKKNTEAAEIFVMDNQGALVAETDKTTDYWQGDEKKFQKTFHGGKGATFGGAIFVDEPAFDESTQAFLVQISVPILDPKSGAAIGALTVGIDLDKLEEKER